MNHAATFQKWLEAGGDRVGQVAIRRGEEGYRLAHVEDIAAIEQGQLQWEALTLHTKPEEARTIGLYDATETFRPLKTAPTLRRGWRLELPPTLGELHLAIEFLYPAAIGLFAASQTGQLATVPLQETLQRQSGMYAVTRKGRPEQIAAAMVACCNSSTGCLRTILWATTAEKSALPADKFEPQPAGKALPLLCQEACNLFVGALRAEIKK